MASFEDMLKEANDLLYMDKYDDQTNGVTKAWNKYTFNVKAAPKAGMKVEHEMSVDNDGGSENKTKLEWKSGDAEFEAEMANDSVQFKAGYPLESDGWSAQTSLEFKAKVNEERTFNATVEVESPDISGTKTKFNIGYEQESHKQDDKWNNSKPIMSFDMCAYNYSNELQVGLNFKHDGTDSTESDVQILKQDQLNKYWVGYSHAQKMAKAGCFIFDAARNFKHTYEARYDLNEGAHGNVMGLPITVTAAGSYALSDDSSLGYSLQKAKGHMCMLTQWSHQLNKNMEMTAHQSYDWHKMAKKEEPYHLGLDFSYKI